MLTCIARSKQPTDDHAQNHTSSNAAIPNKQTSKSLSFQIKDMALKASGAYRHCTPCAAEPAAEQKRRNGSLGGGGSEVDSVAPSEKFRWSHRRTGSSSSGSTAGRKELEARLKVISNGERAPAISASGRRVETVVFVEESEPKEWVAQIEPGVLITFVSLPRGGNDLKRIRFNREMFNKYQAQKWWGENCEKVMELHNVKRLNRQAFPLPTTPRSEGSSKMEFTEEESPTSTTPPLNQEPTLRTLYQPNSSSDSSGVASTPKVSSISGSKMETSSMDTSIRTSTSNDADQSGDISISNVSDMENEWVEQDEPGVYITIRALPDGKRELRRVRFSREKFGEMHAKVWWEENRARIHKLYL